MSELSLGAQQHASFRLHGGSDAFVFTNPAPPTCLFVANATMQEVADGLSFIIAEEKKKADKIAKLKAKSEDDKLSTTKRGIAFSEMKVCMSEDPLPLRKAKLEQEAAVRKAKKVLRASPRHHC